MPGNLLGAWVRAWWSRLYGRQQRRACAEHFPAALTLLAQALRAGMSVLQALQLAATQAPAPVATLLAQMHAAVTTGTPLAQAVQEAASAQQSDDLQTWALVTAVLHETGGNLAASYDRLAALLQQRRALRRKIGLYATQGVVSAVVIGLLPFVMALVMRWVMPKAAIPLWTTGAGWCLVLLGVGWQLAGMVWIRTLLRIKV